MGAAKICLGDSSVRGESPRDRDKDVGKLLRSSALCCKVLLLLRSKLLTVGEVRECVAVGGERVTVALLPTRLRRSLRLCSVTAYNGSERNGKQSKMG